MLQATPIKLRPLNKPDVLNYNMQNPADKVSLPMSHKRSYTA